MLITPDQLRNIATTLSAIRAQQMSDIINHACVNYGIINPLPFKMFIANVVQESLEFQYKSENMNYTKAETIQKTWPKRFPTTLSALPFVKNPSALANKVYGGRMGNTEPNDGWLYRGAGFIGITGKELYNKYSQHINKPVETAAELMRTTDEYAFDSACWFFAILKNLIPIAEKGIFKPVVKGINGGYIGLDVRQKYYDRCNKFL